MGSVSQDQIVIEQARQQQFALELALKQQLRLQTVAEPLLRAAVPLCGAKVRPISGFVAGNAYRWKKDYFNAAMAAGYNDTLTLINVTTGLPAADAGLKVGDRILAIDGAPLVTGPRASDDLASKLPSPKSKVAKRYLITYRRGASSATVTVVPQMACAYTPQVVEADETNAYSDGQSIFVTTGILRFLNDDSELAVVVGHELAHNAMHHIEAKMKNSLMGALLGAVVDVAAATQGVNTKGDFANQGAQLGAMVFSQDFEREADYVGLYILALADRPLDGTSNLWRRMAAAHPGSIKFASSHPTTAERFVRLNTWRGEIEQKVAMGEPLKPEMKGGPVSLASVRPAGGKSNTVVAQTATAQTAALAPAPEPTRVASADKADSKTDMARKAVSLKSGLTTEPVSRPSSDASGTIPSGESARSIIGAPSSETARDAAVGTFAEAKAYMGAHQWTQAEQSFRKTLLLDGSVAKYHAGLGSLLMVLRRWDEAEAEYVAAVLLDLDNTDYRRMVKEARSKR
jgi:predicted Zn-dependent protease